MRKLPKSFTEILDREHRWPKRGDRLLRSSNNWDLEHFEISLRHILQP